MKPRARRWRLFLASGSGALAASCGVAVALLFAWLSSDDFQHRASRAIERIVEAKTGDLLFPTDDRNFVRKGVNWALRAIGGKKSPALRAAARETAARLAASKDKTPRWIGKDALRAFARADARGEKTA